MTDSGPFVGGEASIWLQYAPNREPLFLGCHQLEEISQGKGDKTLIWCPDASGPNKFVVAGSFQGAPEPPTTSIEVVATEVADFLERMGNRRFSLIINKMHSGRRDNYTNWLRSSILTGVTITTETEAGIAFRDPDNNAPTLLTAEVSAEAWYKKFVMTAERQATSEVQNILCMAALPIEFLDDAVKAVAGCHAVALGTANVRITSNSGGTWSATGADPFAADEDVMAIAYFPLTATVNRILAVRELDAAAALEVAYSDDGGASWTLVVVGATVGQGALGARALFALDYRHIWLVTTGGYIYFSSDGGATWTTQDAAEATVQNLNAVHFADNKNGFAVGVADTVLKTTDGGITWSLATATGSGDPLIDVFTLDSDRAWVGIDEAAGDKTWMFTEDGGVTWSNRTFSGSAAGEVRRSVFLNDQIGFLIHNTTGPVGTLWQTRDGGYTWEQITVPTNAGFTHLVAIDDNQVFVSGNASGGTGVFVRARNASPS